MKETGTNKKFSNFGLSDAGKWITTAYNLSIVIPECEHLSYFHDDWSSYDDDFSKEDIQDEIKLAIDEFINTSSPHLIAERFSPIRTEERLKPVLIHLRQLLSEEQQIYLSGELKGIPAQFTRPMVPFFPVNRNIGPEFKLHEPIVKKTGKSSMTVKNTALYSRDVKTLMALTEIMGTKPVYVHGEAFISFRTTCEEIAKETGSKNPYSKEASEAVWNSLERMRACTITWTDKKGCRNIGGILSKARELLIDSSFEVEIFLDADFLQLYKTGYANLQKKALYKMSGKEINAYLFFEGQWEYKRTGKFEMNIMRLHDRMNLEAPCSKRPEYKKRHDMIELMKKCKLAGIIGHYAIKDDFLRVNKSGSLFKSTEIKSTNEKIKTSTNKKSGRLWAVVSSPNDYRDDSDL